MLKNMGETTHETGRTLVISNICIRVGGSLLHYYQIHRMEYAKQFFLKKEELKTKRSSKLK